VIIMIACSIEDDGRKDIARLAPRFVNASYSGEIIVGRGDIAALLRIIADGFEQIAEDVEGVTVQ
jgi:hypothetical protein